MQCKLFATTICGDEARVWNRLEVIEGERERKKNTKRKSIECAQLLHKIKQTNKTEQLPNKIQMMATATHNYECAFYFLATHLHKASKQRGHILSNFTTKRQHLIAKSITMKLYPTLAEN